LGTHFVGYIVTVFVFVIATEFFSSGVFRKIVVVTVISKLAGYTKWGSGAHGVTSVHLSLVITMPVIILITAFICLSVAVIVYCIAGFVIVPGEGPGLIIVTVLFLGIVSQFSWPAIVIGITIVINAS